MQHKAWSCLGMFWSHREYVTWWESRTLRKIHRSQLGPMHSTQELLCVMGRGVTFCPTRSDPSISWFVFTTETVFMSLIPKTPVLIIVCLRWPCRLTLASRANEIPDWTPQRVSKRPWQFPCWLGQTALKYALPHVPETPSWPNSRLPIGMSFITLMSHPHLCSLGSSISWSEGSLLQGHSTGDTCSHKMLTITLFYFLFLLGIQAAFLLTTKAYY